MSIYGTVNSMGTFKATGHSLHGAKVSATRHGLHVVAKSSPHGYNIDIVARKVNAKWGRDATI